MSNVPIAIYVATVLGAVSVWLLMPRERRGDEPRVLGGLLGAAALGGLWLFLGPRMWGEGPGGLGEGDGGIAVGAMRFYYVFSALAILSAVKVITNTRPVYAALWFVMVVLASAGLFVVLSAEFMAFAMLIIYAGAILVTYMFVLMLASQSSEDESGGDPRVSPLYDRVANEPTWAVAAGFVLLATLLSVVFEPMSPVPQAERMSDEAIIGTLMTERRNDALASRLPEAARPLTNEGRVTNTERIGLDLFMGHPLAIELAGVILLVSLIGAVQIARTRVPEEEERMRGGPEVRDASGATAYPQHEPGPETPESQAQYGEANQAAGQWNA
ncbi:MAG: NADH-quinone oxidoreductase subunit J [Phycisphaeraceae bacterium]